ncbi:hypothetical protein JZ751_021033, partial [Albula glossodonta]
MEDLSQTKEVDSQEAMRKEEEEREEDEDKDLQELEDTTSNINITLPNYSQPEPVTEEELPKSYKQNSTQEDQLLHMAENFRCQYVHLHPERKPLLLCPLNECG